MLQNIYIDVNSSDTSNKYSIDLALSNCVFLFTDIDECFVYSPCKNGATCINEVGTFRCICAAGWTGENCTVGKSSFLLFYRSVMFIA